MAYSIQAVIGTQQIFPAALGDGLSIVQLDGGLRMVPLGSGARERYGFPFLPLTDEGCTALPAALQSFCLKLAAHGPVAYIEAEFFGGSGVQACVLFPQSGADAVATISDDAINMALRWLGVQPEEGKDVFSTVGLGRHRETDLWLDDDDLEGSD